MKLTKAERRARLLRCLERRINRTRANLLNWGVWIDCTWTRQVGYESFHSPETYACKWIFWWGLGPVYERTEFMVRHTHLILDTKRVLQWLENPLA